MNHNHVKAFRLKTTIVTIAATAIFGCSSTPDSASSSQSFADQNATVVCPGHVVNNTEKQLSSDISLQFAEALAIYNKGFVETAINNLKRINKSDEFDKAYIYQTIGNWYALKGKHQQSLNYLTMAVSKRVLSDDAHATTLKQIADLYLTKGDYLKAVVGYERFMAFTCRDDQSAYEGISQAYLSAGQFDKALEKATQGIEQYPNNNLRFITVKIDAYRGLDEVDTAIEIAQEALETYPDSKLLKEKLSSLYLQQGDTDSAREVLGYE